MSDANGSKGKFISWDEARKSLIQVNPILTQLIDQLNPSSDLKLIKISYPYGEKIISKGKLCLPEALHDREYIRKQLDHASIPVMCSLNKATELFIENNQHASPYSCLKPGQLLGYYKPTTQYQWMPSLDFWEVTAGARSIFMLPKVTDSKSHKRLWREFGVPFEPPRSLWDHWEIFKTITNHTSQDNQWQSEMLFFTKDWFEDIDDPSWIPLKLYLEHQMVLHNSYLRLYTLSGFLWTLSTNQISNKRGFTPRPYLVDTAKHILAIAQGVGTGFINAADSEIAAPVQAIEKAYIDVYDLRSYLPIIMHASYQRTELDSPCYYSLALPTLLEFNAEIKSKNMPNIITELRDMTFLMHKMEVYFKEHGAPGRPVIQPTRFDYFHTHSEQEEGIQLASELPKRNPRITKTSYTYNDRIFPSSSPFVRGCIQISRTQN